MKLSLPKISLPKFRSKPKTPEQLEQQITEKAARRAAKISARGKARTQLDEARDGRPPRPLAVTIVHWSAYAALFAALAIIAAGYWYDFLFYGQQADDPLIVVGLIAFAFVVRTVATTGDVILHWTKPEKRRSSDPDDGVFGWIADNKGVRWSLRVMWIASIIACSFATISFFSAGHETRQAESAAIGTTETTIVQSKASRIAALEAQKVEAKEARDVAIAAADATIQSIKDESPTVSAADNQTIQQANASKDAANSAYTTTVADLNRQINAINSEKETEIKAVTVERVGAAPFLSVYTFLARSFGTQDGWTIAGAWFFAALFELLCAKLLSTVFALMKILKRVARMIELREASDEMNARIRLERMKSNLEVEGIRLKALHAEERAKADIELAQREREVEKARAQAEALRTGTVWVDPDHLLEEQAALKRAEIEAQIRKIRERAEKLLSGEIDPDAGEAPAAANDPPKKTVGDPKKAGESTAMNHDLNKLDDSLILDPPGVAA